MKDALTDISLKKLPPHHKEAEQCALGACLKSNEAFARALEVIVHEDFYQTAHQKIFRAMEQLFQSGQAVDLLTLSEKLRQAGDLEAAGGLEYLYLLEKMGKKDAALAEANKLLGALTAYRTATDTETKEATPKFVNYDLDGAKWDAARIRLGKLLNDIGDKALREKINPYNQYPNPTGSPDFYGGARY